MFNQNRTFYLPFLVALALAVLPLPGVAQSEPDVYGRGGNDRVVFSSPPANPLPVLFVHGHQRNYKKNWVDRLCDLPSFDQALERNPDLGIEPYYLHLRGQHRPIEDDAAEIAHAVDLILNRHDQDYDPSDPARTSHVQVAVIALSKGSISSRLYLKQLSEYAADGCDGSRDLPCVGPGFYPVSEHIAIAPPNHGLASSALFVGDSEALQQLNNGYGPTVEVELPGIKSCLRLDGGHGFIDELNGHPICDTFARPKLKCLISTCLCDKVMTTPKASPSEAPLSRAPEAPLQEGVLYLTLFAENGGDEFIGGDELSDDCQGRRLALNLSPHAVNVPLPAENVSCIETTHALTPHWPETICRALYTAAHHRVPEGAFHCPRDADKVPEVPAPAAIHTVLALDLSGSMGAQPCPTCGPKVDYLRQAVELFIKLWGVVARQQDGIGAVSFRSAADLLPPGGEALGPVGSHGDAILAELGAQDPGGSTAMGGALHSAIGTLSGLPPNEGGSRNVILFTDGMQNRNPRVRDDGRLVIADDSAWRPLPSGLGSIDLEQLQGIKIHTIGIGAGDPANELLEKLADRTGGRFRSSFDIGVLRQFFVEKVIDVMRGFSPQLVSYRRGSTGDDKQAIETFEIDGGARRVIFKVSVPLGGEFNLQVGKDGHLLTGSGQSVGGSFYRILSFDLPLAVDGTTIEAGGEWTLGIENTAGGDLAYEIAAIVDGARLHHEASLGPSPYVAGRPLQMAVELRAGGLPLTGATVSARVLRSDTALGTLLATTPMPGGPVPSLEPGTTGGQKKLQALLLDPEVWADLKPVEALGAGVELVDQGDGTYRGSYDNTSIPGSYNVIFNIRGTDAEGREVRRTEALSAQVEVGELLLPDFLPKVRIVDGQLKLTFRPRDRFGNYLGPDYGDRIRLAHDSGSPAPVVDRLDGGYEVTLPLPAGRDPSIELEVLGRRLFEGPISELAPSGNSRWVLSAHLGYALPAGALDRLYDPGPLAELDLEYAVAPRVALRGVLGRYRFDPDFEVDGATLYLRYYRPWKSPAHRPGAPRLFAEIGPGVYDPEGIGSTAGLSVGFGVCREFRPRLESELGASYFHLFTPGDDLRFAALKAGLRVSF